MNISTAANADAWYVTVKNAILAKSSRLEYMYERAQSSAEMKQYLGKAEDPGVRTVEGTGCRVHISLSTSTGLVLYHPGV